MPHNALRLAEVVIRVDIGLAYTYTAETRGKQSRNDTKAVRVRIATDIHRHALTMGRRAGTAFLLFPRLTPICRVKDERDTRYFAGQVQLAHRVLVHILQRTRWSAGAELRLAEILRRYHLSNALTHLTTNGEAIAARQRQATANTGCR